MNIFHFVFHELTNGLDFVFGNFEDKFVVDLQCHARFQSARLKLAIDADHGELDQVGGGSLQWRVDGGALGESAQVRVLAVDVGDGAHTSEEREDLAVATCLLERAVDEAANATVLFEVSVDELLGLARLDADLLGKSEGREAVDDAEVDGLGAAPVLGGRSSAVARQRPATQ